MWGYRLVRDADWTAITAEMAALRRQIAEFHLLRTKDAAGLAGALARADFMTARNHVLETNLATLEQKWLGVPRSLATVHEVGATASPLEDGLLSLEDVGDARAAEMKLKGMLHDDGDELELPSAASLAPAPQFDHDEES